MNLPSAAPVLLTRRDEFLERAIERLGAHPSDFREMMGQIAASPPTSPRRAAGVLLPLVFRALPSGGSVEEEEFRFVLIKRSRHIPQPGDLSCPGGMLHPFLDRLLRHLLTLAPLPILRGEARSHALRRGRETFRITTLFLTNALREAWEELRIPPWNVRFLGPIPTHSLVLFTRTIFPVAGLIDPPGLFRPNGEVERLLEIPLASFYREELFSRYSLEEATAGKSHDQGSRELPCFVHRDAGGGEEVLWGATFNIIVRFLEITLDYRLPDWRKGRIIRRTLRSDYLTGRRPA